MEKAGKDDLPATHDEPAESSMTKQATDGTTRRRTLAALFDIEKDEVPGLAQQPVELSSVIKQAEGAMMTRRRRLVATFMEAEKGAQVLRSSSHSALAIREEKLVKEQSRSAAAEEEERAKVMETSGSWVLDMERLLDDTDHKIESARWQKKLIYRVPEFLKRIIAVRDAFEPKMVSLGPMHHGQRHLLPMEAHKRRALLHLVKRSNKPLWQFVTAIEQVSEDVLGAYDGIDEEWGANKPRFVQMLLTDGCFLLEVMQIAIFLEDEHDYAINDPLFSVEMFRKLWPLIRNDMVCIENQIPLIVLHKIQFIMDDQGTVQSSKTLVNLMIHNILNFSVAESNGGEGVHILDLLHSSFTGSPALLEETEGYVLSVPSASELHDSGVQFISGKPKCVHDIHFENGILKMPKMELGGNALIIFLNMAAFEWIIPGTKREVTSYICFIDKIIQSEKDLALLRSKGIFTGTDQKTVDMIKTMNAVSWFPEPGSRLGNIQFKIHSYCKKRRNVWRAIFKKKFLSNPFVFISLMVALLYFVETGLQTVFSVLAYFAPHQD